MRKKTRGLLFVIISILFICSAVSAQEQENQTTTAKPSGETYLKLNLSMLNISVSGFEIKNYSLGIDIDSYFKKRKFFISGFSVGYRREPSNIFEIGHYISGKGFATLPGFMGFVPKISAGMEWGYPSFDYDRARFHYDANGRPDHRQLVYMKRNSRVPVVAPSKDGVLYPFSEVGLAKKAGPFVFEGGVRFTFTRFRNDYYYSNDSGISFSRSESLKILPRVFVGVGLRLF